MKNSIWQESVLEKKTIGIFAAIAGGSWLVGILGMLIFQAFIKNDKALFPIATVLLVGIGSIFLLFLLANSFAHKFNLAISMGRTRKSYLPSVAFLIFIIVLMVYVMGGIGFLIEKGLYGLLYHGRKLTGNMGPFLTPAWLLCYTVFETGLICLYGSLMKKDRKMGTIFFLITWVLFCWTSGGFWGNYDGMDGSIMSRFTFLGYQIRIWFTSYSTEIRMAILVLIGLAGYFIMYLMLRREAAD